MRSWADPVHALQLHPQAVTFFDQFDIRLTEDKEQVAVTGFQVACPLPVRSSIWGLVHYCVE
jgi:hypothetical protein